MVLFVCFLFYSSIPWINVLLLQVCFGLFLSWGRRDRMVVGSTTTYAISAYNHQRCAFEFRSGEVYSIQHYVIKFVSDGGFLLLLRFSSTNKTDLHEITEILLEMVLNTITLTLTQQLVFDQTWCSTQKQIVCFNNIIPAFMRDRISINKL